MKKIRNLLFSFIFCLCILSCSQDWSRVICTSSNWIVLQFNDTILMCMPKNDAYKPYIININHYNKNIENQEIQQEEYNIIENNEIDEKDL